MRRPTALLSSTLLAGALTLTACGGGDQVDLEPVQQAIDALDSAQGDLRTRMSDIEQSLAALSDVSGDGENVAATGLLERLDALDEALQGLRDEFDQYLLDAADKDAELESLIADLEATLNGVTTTLSGLRTDISNLREDHELLKQRFERHLQDHNG